MANNGSRRPPPAPARVRRPGAVDPGALRQAFRRHAAGVTVVTMTGPKGPVGFTATSVASLSERPPLLSLSLSTRSSIVPVLLTADTLLVHLLSDGQHALAARFAEPGADRFGPSTRWRQLRTGEPLLLDAAVWLRCRIRSRTPTGDHYLVVAEVVDSRADQRAAPLVYHDGSYGTMRSGGGSSGDGDLGIRGGG